MNCIDVIIMKYNVIINVYNYMVWMTIIECQLTLQVDKIPVFIRTQMAVEWILSTVHTFRRENFLLV